MDEPSTYCVMPHFGMAVQNHADFCCCNLNKRSWKNNERETMYVHQYFNSSVFNSPTRKIIAASLDNNIKHSSCKVCWDLEEAGSVSSRQIFNERFGHLKPLPNQPRILIIKPGNTCNFACRMCNPMTSSSWYSDGHEIKQAGLTSSSWYNDEMHKHDVSVMTFNEYTRSFENIRNSFGRNNNEFWDTLKSWIENLVFIDIYGGEPFLIPAMFDLLNHGVEIGASKNIELAVSTNASIFNEQYFDILRQYKTVNLLLSIDSLDAKQFEYIRYKSEFDVVIDNCKKIQEIVKKYPSIRLSVTYTITPLNVYYADRTIQQLRDLFKLPINVNLVTTPEYDIRHLPIPVKQYLIKNISNSVVVNFLKQTIPGCDIEWPKFFKTTDLLDKSRNQNFSEVFPEWWELLKNHWIK